MASQINDVGTVTVARKDETVTLVKKDNGWVVAEKYKDVIDGLYAKAEMLDTVDKSTDKMM